MSETTLASEPTQAALRTRITAGILYAAARFVPVPLLDDLVREQIARWMVVSSLPALSKEGTRPLWADDSGCIPGCLGKIAMLPIQLLLFPIRKVLAILFGVRWVSRDIASMLLLGRVLDHALANHLLEAETDDALAAKAREVRTAFDVAMRSTDTRFLVALLSTALGPIRGLVAAAMRTLRSLRRTRSEEPKPEGGDAQVIDASVGRIEKLLLQPEVRQFLAEFDRRVLENLDVLAQRRLPTAS